MKKILCYLIVAVLILSGCGKKTATSETPGENKKLAATPAVTAEKEGVHVEGKGFNIVPEQYKILINHLVDEGMPKIDSIVTYREQAYGFDYGKVSGNLICDKETEKILVVTIADSNTNDGKDYFHIMARSVLGFLNDKYKANEVLSALDIDNPENGGAAEVEKDGITFKREIDDTMDMFQIYVKSNNLNAEGTEI